jgi:hypothetical protein
MYSIIIELLDDFYKVLYILNLYSDYNQRQLKSFVVYYIELGIVLCLRVKVSRSCIFKGWLNCGIGYYSTCWGKYPVL